jgi:hypothetical protein
VEQYYRDNRLNMIHEGTHGIQALDLLGRKVMMKQGAAFQRLGVEISRSIEEANLHAELRGCAEALGTAWSDVTATVDALRPALASDAERALANASAFLEAFGHVVLAWTWLRQANVAAAALQENQHEDDANFYRGKLQTCQWFFRWELPRTAHQLKMLRSLDDTTLTMAASWF